MNETALIAAALECGAAKATMIDVADIAMDTSFRDICASNGCGNYGRSWTCPPADGPVEETMAKIRTFSRALWYQTVGEIEDSFDFEGMIEVAKHHSDVGQRLHDRLPDLIGGQFLHMGGGNCKLCEKCAYPDPCRFPDRRLPAMEGWGVDVYNTTKKTDLKYINGKDTVTYFGMVLF
ncbi:MAG: DUF2284 domain-containing protein [Clostridia bacterium]|nr:DUF2284 domain-containing protein [Clostridia bacterium]